MSLCWSSLVLLLGAVLTSGSPLHSMSDGVRLPPESFADLLRLKEPEVGSKPLFTSVIRSINMSCQRKEDIQLMNATLDVYTRILSSILQRGHFHQQQQQQQQQQQNGRAEASPLLDTLQSSERSQVKSEVRKLQQAMEELQRNLNQEHHSREEMMRELSKIKVDDPVDQRRALAEFQVVYKAASLIGSHCGHPAHQQ